MTLDIGRLENVVRLPDGRTRARCPACAAAGGDRKGEHLMIFADGRFGCAAHPGDKGHRREILRIAGNGSGKRGGRGARKRIFPRPVKITKPTWGGWGG